MKKQRKQNNSKNKKKNNKQKIAITKTKHRHMIFHEIWFLIGFVISLWTIFWFVKVRILNDYAFIINVSLLVIGYTLLVTYIITTAFYIIFKRLKKLHKI